MKKIISIVVIAILIIGGITLSINEKSAEQVVRFGYLPAVHALPLFVAQEKGYFAEQGIRAEITKFEAPNQIIDALISGHIDMALAAATGITAIAESKNPNSLKVFAVAGGDKEHIAEAILVGKDSSIASIADLKGKKVGVLPGIQWKTIARNIFLKNSLDIDKDLTLVELAIPLQAQALASKQIDALLAIEPVITVADSLDISKILVKSPNLVYVSDPFYAGVGNVSVKFVNENPESLKKALTALEMAHADIDKDVDSLRHYFPAYIPLTPELASKVNLPVYKMYKDFTSADIDAIEKFVGVFKEYNVITSPLSAAAFLFDK
ncbi:MAG: ABC transporter substrate-binding protein [Patescibacteria group bacterium]